MFHRRDEGFFVESQPPVESSSTDGRDGISEACSFRRILEGKTDECQMQAKELLFNTYTNFMDDWSMGEGLKIFLSPALLPFINTMEIKLKQVPWVLLFGVTMAIVIYLKLSLGLKVLLSVGVSALSPLWGFGLAAVTVLFFFTERRASGYGPDYKRSDTGTADWIFAILVALVGLGFLGFMAWVPPTAVLYGVAALLVLGFTASIPRVVEKSAPVGFTMIGLIVTMVLVAGVVTFDRQALARGVRMLVTNDWYNFNTIPQEAYDTVIRTEQYIAWRNRVERKVLEAKGKFEAALGPSDYDPFTIASKLLERMSKASTEELRKIKSAPFAKAAKEPSEGSMA